MASDDSTAKVMVAGLIDQIGFDVRDVGPLAAGRRFQPGTSVYNMRLDIHELAGALDLRVSVRGYGSAGHNGPATARDGIGGRAR